MEKTLEESVKVNNNWIFLSNDFSGITFTFRVFIIDSIGYFLITSIFGNKISFSR